MYKRQAYSAHLPAKEFYLGLCCAWLHDTIEDCGVTHAQLEDLFGIEVADGVAILSDIWDAGDNRAQRQASANRRLAAIDSEWLSNVKLADITSNLTDPAALADEGNGFAAMYGNEKHDNIAVLDRGTLSLRILVMDTLETYKSFIADRASPGAADAHIEELDALPIHTGWVGPMWREDADPRGYVDAAGTAWDLLRVDGVLKRQKRLPIWQQGMQHFKGLSDAVDPGD